MGQNDSISIPLRELLTTEAKDAGFDLSGVVDIELAAGFFKAHVERYDQWLEAGRAGEMHYLIRGRDRRADPALVFPGAKSVFCVGLRYADLISGTQPNGPRQARYLNGPKGVSKHPTPFQDDYHEVIRVRLNQVMERVADRWNSQGEGKSLAWKICVDTSAVLERAWAALAGLGWIGKNSMLIHPQLGSFFFLAEVLINQESGCPPSPLPNYCGNCDRCLKACPTGALVEPGQLDSNSCISYLTLEKRGRIEISPEKKAQMGTWIAGCDICQEVCPFNCKALKKGAIEGEFAPAHEHLKGWVSLLDEPSDVYKKRVKSSALSRVKEPQFSRNLAIALANHLVALEGAQARDAYMSLEPRIRGRYQRELEPNAKAEWFDCLQVILAMR